MTVPRFARAERVSLKSNPERVGIVQDFRHIGGEVHYDLFFSAVEFSTYPEHALLSFEEEAAGRDPLAQLMRWQFAAPEQFMSYLTYAKLSQPLASTIYSYLASRTRLLPYQFKPVLKLLDNPYGRLLVADEVGLGKTIEAGIILTELAARGPLPRILVCCPSALRSKWRDELRERFDLDFQVPLGHELRRLLDESRLRPAQPLRVVVSQELLRREENLQALQESGLTWDVVVVDEAHHMRNRGTRTNFLGSMLSDLADVMLFLTATPLNLGQEDFFELLRLLVPEEFESFHDFPEQIAPNEHLNTAIRVLRAVPGDSTAARAALSEAVQIDVGNKIRRDPRYDEIMAMLELPLTRESSVHAQKLIGELNVLSHIFTRTRKREVSELFPLRRATAVEVTFTPEEASFYDAVGTWVRECNRGRRTGAGTFVLMMFQRMLASCIPATLRKLENTLGTGVLEFEEDDISELELELGFETDAEVLGLAMARRQDQLASDLARTARAVKGIDSKYAAFEGALHGLFEAGQAKVMVFSFFVGTIDYLHEQLARFSHEGRPVQVFKIYGPVPADRRSGIVEAFRDTDQPAVLLSSEVGSEGLDFQFCSVIVNYDLPWNPMRVEQRIGRIDRYGQLADRVQILNLVNPETIEGRIFHRLYERIGIFREAIGDLEAILASGPVEYTLSSFTREVVFGELTHDEQRERTELIAQAIVRQQHDLEEFGRESERFLGHDEVFIERFNDIERGHRYISPDEVENLVRRFIVDKGFRVRLEVSKGRAVRNLVGADVEKLYDEMRMHFANTGSATQLDWNLAHRLVRQGRRPLTFDARDAAETRSLEFVSIHHPLVRTIAAEIAARPSPPAAVLLEVDAEDGIEPGLRLFFTFRFETTGVRAEIDFVPVVVRHDATIDEALTADGLSGIFERARAATDNQAELLTEPLVQRSFEAAYARATDRARDQESSARLAGDRMLAQQLVSHELGYTRKVRRAQDRLAVADDVRIIRLLNGQIRNLEWHFEQKRAGLEAKRGVEVGVQLVACGGVDVVARG